MIFRLNMQEMERIISSCLLIKNINVNLSEALGAALETLDGDDEDA